MDHTSVLKLIAQKFGKGSYSKAVDTRRIAGKPAGDIAAALTLNAPRTDIPMPDGQNIGFTSANGPGADPVAQGFKDAFDKLMEKQPNEMEKRYPELTRRF